MSIMNKEFWLDALERCVGTMAEVAIPLVPVSSVAEMDLSHIAVVVLGSGLVCLFKCIVKATAKGE